VTRKRRVRTDCKWVKRRGWTESDRCLGEFDTILDYVSVHGILLRSWRRYIEKYNEMVDERVLRTRRSHNARFEFVPSLE